jgi:hypothetical protein
VPLGPVLFSSAGIAIFVDFAAGCTANAAIHEFVAEEAGKTECGLRENQPNVV